MPQYTFVCDNTSKYDSSKLVELSSNIRAKFSSHFQMKCYQYNPNSSEGSPLQKEHVVILPAFLCGRDPRELVTELQRQRVVSNLQIRFEHKLDLSDKMLRVKFEWREFLPDKDMRKHLLAFRLEFFNGLYGEGNVPQSLIARCNIPPHMAVGYTERSVDDARSAEFLKLSICKDAALPIAMGMIDVMSSSGSPSWYKREDTMSPWVSMNQSDGW